jgi:site-specific DNA-cytosine methylase
MKILIACEESQTVCKAFRLKGHEAFSCDILPASGGRREWHYECDIRDVLNERDWDMVIAFPPCTDLAVSGARWFNEKRKDGRQAASIDFFMIFSRLKTPKVCIENPIGIMSTIFRPLTRLYNHGNSGIALLRRLAYG